MKNVLVGKIMSLSLENKKYIAIQQIKMIKINKQKAEKSVSQSEKLNLRIIKIIQKQINREKEINYLRNTKLETDRRKSKRKS